MALVKCLTHLIATLQGICYVKCKLPPIIPEQYFILLITNTKPERLFENQQIETIKSLMITSIEELENDYAKEKFQVYAGAPNIFKVYGIDIKNIDDAIEFLLYHEGYHTGYILSLKRLVS